MWFAIGLLNARPNLILEGISVNRSAPRTTFAERGYAILSDILGLRALQIDLRIVRNVCAGA